MCILYCQVIKVIAKDKGFTDIPVAKRVRRSWRRYRGLRLAYKNLTSSLKLRQMKRRYIHSGKIDVGIPIVPIDYTVITIMAKKSPCNGQSYIYMQVLKIDLLFQIETKHTVSGRKFSLKSIREDHLQRMKKLNLLRNTDSMTLPESTLFAHKHGGYFLVHLKIMEKALG